MQKHWAAKYEQSTDKFEYTIYLVACQSYNATENYCRNIAEIVVEQNCGIWHATAVYNSQNDDRPICKYCGSKMDPRLLYHHLCHEKHKRGLDTPPLDDRMRCSCAVCLGGPVQDFAAIRNKTTVD